MLMYGICCNAIKNIKWNNVIELVKGCLSESFGGFG